MNDGFPEVGLRGSERIERDFVREMLSLPECLGEWPRWAREAFTEVTQDGRRVLLIDEYMNAVSLARELHGDRWEEV